MTDHDDDRQVDIDYLVGRMPQPAPSVGRIVHYRLFGTPGGEYKGECRAAIVTEVDETLYAAIEDAPYGRVGLAVVNPIGLFFRSLADGGCEYHEGDVGHDHAGEEIPQRSYRGGSWHWPIPCSGA